MADYELNLRDYFYILRKRKKIVAGVTIGVVIFTFLLSPSSKPVYEAVSSVKIMQTAPVSGLVQEVISYREWDNFQTQTRIIKSQKTMMNVARRLGLVGEDVSVDEILTSREAVKEIEKLQEHTTVERDENTNIIEITFESENMDEARDYVNMIANVYVEDSNYEKNRQINEAISHLEARLKEQRKILEENQELVRQFILDNIENLSLGSGGLSTVFEEYVTLSREIESLKRQIEQASMRLETGKGFDWISSDQGDPTLQKLNSQLIDLMAQKQELLVEHTTKSPSVVDLEERIKIQLRDIIKEYEETLKGLEQRKGKLYTMLSKMPLNDDRLDEIRNQVSDDRKLLSDLKEKYQNAKLREAEKAIGFAVVEYATGADKIEGTGKMARTIAGLMMGLVMSIVAAFVRESIDTSIGTIEDVELYIGSTVLGVVPNIHVEDIRARIIKKKPQSQEDSSLDKYAHLITLFEPKSPVAEAYRTLRTNLEFARIKKKGNTFLVTSSTLQEGKTTTVVNLAITMAQLGKRTLLVGANLRRPVLYKMFGLDMEPGLTNVMLGTVEWKDAIKSLTDILTGRMVAIDDVLMAAGLDNLKILTCGSMPPNPSELIGSDRMEEFISEVSEEFDIVLFDAPPTLPVTDSVILGSKVDGTIIVYKVGRVARGMLKRAKAHLEAVGANVWGVILNDVRAEVSSSLTSYHYYGEKAPAVKDFVDDTYLPERDGWERRLESLKRIREWVTDKVSDSFRRGNGGNGENGGKGL
jgi:capsular exopolysaccharide synthesis family protein